MKVNSSKGMVEVLSDLDGGHVASAIVRASDGLFYRVQSPVLFGGYLAAAAWSASSKTAVQAKSSEYRVHGGPKNV